MQSREQQAVQGMTLWFRLYIPMIRGPVCCHRLQKIFITDFAFFTIVKKP